MLHDNMMPTIPNEAKLAMNTNKHFGQFVETCIVHAFVENDLHPQCNPLTQEQLGLMDYPLTPAVLISRQKFRIALYDPVKLASQKLYIL